MRRAHEMLQRTRSEDGIALIVALIVIFVIVIFATAVVVTSAVNVNQSGRNRTQTQAIAVAEAGIHDVFAVLAKATPANLPCTRSGTIESAPLQGTFSATVTYADATGNPIANFCSQSPRPLPAKALITSSGSVGGSDRSMTAAIDLKPIYGGFDVAMYADKLLSAGQTANVTPASTGEPGDIYSNGDVTIQNSATISGSIVAQGAVLLSNNGEIGGDVWAKNKVTINNPRVVLGDVTSSTSSVEGHGRVVRNVRAGTTISPSLVVEGTRTPTSPSDPPPAMGFPQVVFDAQAEADWAAGGYDIKKFTTCAGAKIHIETLSATTTAVPPTVVHINSSPPCNLAFHNTTVNVRNNLAIVTNGSFRLSGGSGAFRGLPASQKWTLQVISVHQPGQVCSTDHYDITKRQSSSFVDLRVFLYTPCQVTLEQNTTIEGQIIAGSISWSNSLTLTYYQHAIFGSRHVTGFDQDIRYFREVQ